MLHVIPNKPKQAQAVVLHQLAAHGAAHTDRPTHRDVGVEHLVEEAGHWWDMRIRADLAYGAVLMHEGPDMADRVREIYGLFGSVAEQAMLVGAVEIEIEYLRRAIANGDLPGGMIISQRWFSEHESQTLLSVGHVLMNLVVRVGLLLPDARKQILACKRFGDFVDERGSDDQAAWRSLSSKDLDAIRGVIAANGGKHLKTVVHEMKQLADSDAWTYVDRQRGEDFHRWRRESSVLAGINSRPKPYTPATAIRVGINLDGYEDANQMEEFIADINRDAIGILCDTMSSIRTNLAEIVERLANGRQMI